MICRHRTVKPFAEIAGIIQSLGAGFGFSAREREYCTQLNSLRLPRTLVGDPCEGDVEECDITLAGG